MLLRQIKHTVQLLDTPFHLFLISSVSIILVLIPFSSAVFHIFRGSLVFSVYFTSIGRKKWLAFLYHSVTSSPHLSLLYYISYTLGCGVLHRRRGLTENILEER